jgi:hypothetical protein
MRLNLWNLATTTALIIVLAFVIALARLDTTPLAPTAECPAPVEPPPCQACACLRTYP